MRGEACGDSERRLRKRDEHLDGASGVVEADRADVGQTAAG
jgi:hypothetical protein